MPLNGFDLHGKKGLLVGANNNVGQAILSAMTEAGADMLGIAVTKPSSSSVVGSEPSTSDLEVAVTAIASDDGANRIFQTALSKLGRVDILVNNFDLAFAKPLVDITESELDMVLAANLSGVFWTMKHVGRHMIDNGGGRVVNVTSALGERGLPNVAAYCIAKGGVTQLTKAAALEWGPSGVYVNGLGLGWIEGDPIAVSNPELVERLQRYLPMHRLGSPDEVGALAVYLGSDACGYMSGHTVYVDGGVMTKL